MTSLVEEWPECWLVTDDNVEQDKLTTLTNQITTVTSFSPHTWAVDPIQSQILMALDPTYTPGSHFLINRFIHKLSIIFRRKKDSKKAVTYVDAITMLK